MLSTITAPAGELAGHVASILSSPKAGEFAPPAWTGGLSGPGTRALRPPSVLSVPETPTYDNGLYCPPALRDDPALAETVNEAVVAWAESLGMYEGRLDVLRAANFGNLVTLSHPDCDDPDRLLAAAKCACAEWTVDDYYSDNDELGSDTENLGPRLTFAVGAVDPVHLVDEYEPAYREHMDSDPVLRGLSDSFRNFADYASPSQVGRLRHEFTIFACASNAEGGWRTQNRQPNVPEYLNERHLNSFLPCMTLTDSIGGYELPTHVYYQADVRRTVNYAATAATIVNDVYSASREGPDDTNLPGVLQANEGLGPVEALEKTVAVHNELVHRFEKDAYALSQGDPTLRRFFAGMWAWMGGNRQWHATSERYN
ncbi:family 2 encapsulin nanocompartment cargo protein terpene cyclase [Salininema proteolyticum]|uniref:Terpene synthase n=1 Tax=Salininema proteolyticum TaxID=1607685 RepID=A0ABV8TXT6_9ACTN